MASIKVKSEYKELVKLFNQLSGSRSLWQVFNDCMEMFALSIQNTFCFSQTFEKNENRYKDITKNYSESEIETIVKIFAEITNALEANPFQDFLGDLYMQLDMGSSALGQFFTPYTVSYAMTVSSFDEKNAKAELSQKGYISVLEPAVGGGANVIAFCEVLKNHDINYQTQCVIVCQELSKLTALMCYTALSLIGCAAVVKIGDSLSDPYTNYFAECSKGAEIWTTPMFHIQNCYKKV
jgi:type I restriction-modification system DNA methylase subunit